MLAHDGQSPLNWKHWNEWPYRIQDEAEITDKLLRYLGDGVTQPLLLGIWGPKLPKLMTCFSAWLFPWLESPLWQVPQPMYPGDVSLPLVEDEDEIPLGKAARLLWSLHFRGFSDYHFRRFVKRSSDFRAFALSLARRRRSRL
jgi:hypothetical protein